MRPKRPTHVLMDQVRITREGGDAIIDHADANLSGERITGIATMTDAEYSRLIGPNEADTPKPQIAWSCS